MATSNEKREGVHRDVRDNRDVSASGGLDSLFYDHNSNRQRQRAKEIT